MTFRPELRGRFGLFALSAVVVAGAALALTLGFPSERASQTAPALDVQADRHIAGEDAVVQRVDVPSATKPSLEHYARLLSQPHALYWDHRQRAPWPFTLAGTWDVESSAWRKFKLGDAAVGTALPWLTVFPLGEAQPQGILRARTGKAPKGEPRKAASTKAPRPGSKPGGSSNARR